MFDDRGFVGIKRIHLVANHFLRSLHSVAFPRNRFRRLNRLPSFISLDVHQRRMVLIESHTYTLRENKKNGENIPSSVPVFCSFSVRTTFAQVHWDKAKNSIHALTRREASPYYFKMCDRIISCLLLCYFFFSLGLAELPRTIYSRQVEYQDSTPQLQSDASIPQTAGPSGTLIKPQGGAVYKNHIGSVGNIEVIYKGVSDGTNDFGARTCTIDIHLVPKTTKQNARSTININNPLVIHLSYGLRPHDSGSSQPIWANFVPPPGACGDYYLVVYERQLYQDTVIHFQSAAPVIHFECANRLSRKIYPPNSISELWKYF